MYGSREKMCWKYFFVFFNLIVCIYCESWLNDNDKVQSYQPIRNDHVKSESRTFNGHNRHSFHNEAEMPLKQFQVLSDDPVVDGEPSVPFNEAAADRKYVRRTNFRRRKISSNTHKKNIFRRGQRHRQNKNGKLIRISRQQINFLLITQSKQSQTVLISVCARNELFCPFLSASSRIVGVCVSVL